MTAASGSESAQHTHAAHWSRRALFVATLGVVATLSFVVSAYALLGTATTHAGPTAPAARNIGLVSTSPLVGTFNLQSGSCASGETGSYFRMILPGEAINGPDSSYISNGNSTCSDKTYTLLSPGSQGGLVTGSYQPGPSPAFDGSGNALAAQIIQPTTFFGVQFSVETSSKDAQTGSSVLAPSISVDGSGNLSGSLEAFSAAWNAQYFNQGSPKPGGSLPGETAGPTGTYDSSTGAFTLSWTSQIVGGPFNSFTGQWHLSGTFDAAPGSTGSTTTTTTTTAVGSSTPTTASSSTAGGLSSSGSSTHTAATTAASTGSATPSEDVPNASSLAGNATSNETGQGGALAYTGLSIPLWLPVPPLAVGGLLLLISRRWSRRTLPVSR